MNRHIEAVITENLVFVHISVNAQCIIIIFASTRMEKASD